MSLFGESPPENNAPVFSNKEDMKFIYADRGDYGFSYSAEEKPKSINLVKPEEIAKAVEKCFAETNRKNHILNLNHGLLERTPFESVQHFVNVAKELGKI